MKRILVIGLGVVISAFAVMFMIIGFTATQMEALYYHQNFLFSPQETRAECALGVRGELKPEQLAGDMIAQFPYAGMPVVDALPGEPDRFVVLSRDRCGDLPAIVWTVLRDRNEVQFFDLTVEDWARLPHDFGPPVWREHPQFDARYWAMWPHMREGDVEALIGYYAPDLDHAYETDITGLPQSPSPSPQLAYANLLQAFEGLPEGDPRRAAIGDRLKTLYRSMDARDRQFFDNEADNYLVELSRLVAKLRWGLLRPDRGPTEITPQARQAARDLFQSRP